MIISLPEAKDYLKIEAEYTADDTLLTYIIGGVGDYIDRRLERHLHNRNLNNNVPVMPDSDRFALCFVLRYRDGIKDAGRTDKITIYQDGMERQKINPAADVTGHYFRPDAITGYIVWPPTDEERDQITDRYNLVAAVTPYEGVVVPPAIKVAACVLVHSLYSHRTTAFGSDQHNLAEKLLDPHKNLI